MIKRTREREREKKKKRERQRERETDTEKCNMEIEEWKEGMEKGYEWRKGGREEGWRRREAKSPSEAHT